MIPSPLPSLPETPQERVAVMDRIARLPIRLQAEGTLRKNMPVEAAQPDRAWIGKPAWEGAGIPADPSLSDKDFSRLILP